MKVSVPILQTIYPMAIVFDCIGIFVSVDRKMEIVYPVNDSDDRTDKRFLYIRNAWGKMGVITTVLKSLPLYKEQLVWIIPAIFGLAVGILSSILLPKRGRK